MFQSTTQIQPSNPPKDPIVAALLSAFLLGGVGQLFIGQQKKGMILIGVWVLGLCVSAGLLSMVVQGLGAYDAYMMATKMKEGKAIGDMEFFWETKA